VKVKNLWTISVYFIFISYNYSCSNTIICKDLI